MVGSINREKKKGLIFIALGVVLSLFSYQNFKYYPENIHKTSVDVTGTLRQSDTELRRFRSHMANKRAQQVESPRAQAAKPLIPKTQVTDAPMKLKLKRAPAKTTPSKTKSKKKKKPKTKPKPKPKANDS
jgi:hypothetical protein